MIIGRFAIDLEIKERPRYRTINKKNLACTGCPKDRTRSRLSDSNNVIVSSFGYFTSPNSLAHAGCFIDPLVGVFSRSTISTVKTVLGYRLRLTVAFSKVSAGRPNRFYFLRATVPAYTAPVHAKS